MNESMWVCGVLMEKMSKAWWWSYGSDDVAPPVDEVTPHQGTPWTRSNHLEMNSSQSIGVCLFSFVCVYFVYTLWAIGVRFVQLCGNGNPDHLISYCTNENLRGKVFSNVPLRFRNHFFKKCRWQHFIDNVQRRDINAQIMLHEHQHSKKRIGGTVP